MLVATGILYLSARIAIAKQQAPDPEIILMLGGGPDRERFVVQFAQIHPSLNVWVSSGSPDAVQIFQTAGIASSRVYFDCRATDTVTNFTTVVHNFKQRGIEHVYVVTSDVHMARSAAIATIVLGSHGITFTPVKVPSEQSPESPLRILRDVGRSLVWVATGRTGASLNRRVAC